MSDEFKQTLIDINNISYHLSIEEAKRIEKIAEKLLDVKLLETLPHLQITELEEMDVTEKLMLLKEYSLPENQRSKEKEEAIRVQDFEKAATLRDEENKSKEELEEASKEISRAYWFSRAGKNRFKPHSVIIPDSLKIPCSDNLGKNCTAASEEGRGLVKVIIPHKIKDEFLWQLSLKGITEEYLLPPRHLMV